MNFPSIVLLCGKARVCVEAISIAYHTLESVGLKNILHVCPAVGDLPQDGWQPSVRSYCEKLKVPIVDVDAFRAEENLLLISLEYDKIIRTKQFHSNRLYNIHFSALPKYRGVFTSIWPIINGEKESGVTLHVMDEGIDTGQIIDQLKFPLPAYLTSRMLYDLYLWHGVEIFRRNFLSLVQGTPLSHPQHEAEATYYDRKSIDLSNLEIDPSLPSFEVSRRARALIFPEYQLPKFQNRKVTQCRELGIQSDLPTGTITSQADNSCSLVCGDGKLVEILWETKST